MAACPSCGKENEAGARFCSACGTQLAVVAPREVRKTVMAVFGIPQVHEDDALRAARAAVELRDAVTELVLRIGVNTGEVVAGTGETLVTGDAVTAAARLEQAAEPGTVLVGEQTYRLVRDGVEATPVASVEAKGKS